MEPSGRNWSQPVADGAAPTKAQNKRKPLPWVATGCLSRSMVRRGSAVRVRKRALRKRRKSALFLWRQLARCPTWRGYAALYGAFRSKAPSQSRPFYASLRRRRERRRGGWCACTTAASSAAPGRGARETCERDASEMLRGARMERKRPLPEVATGLLIGPTDSERSARIADRQLAGSAAFRAAQISSAGHFRAQSGVTNE
jgi:hypothetical protein